MGFNELSNAATQQCILCPYIHTKIMLKFNISRLIYLFYFTCAAGFIIVAVGFIIVVFCFTLKSEAVLRAGFFATLDLCSTFKDMHVCLWLESFLCLLHGWPLSKLEQIILFTVRSLYIKFFREVLNSNVCSQSNFYCPDTASRTILCDRRRDCVGVRVKQLPFLPSGGAEWLPASGGAKRKLGDPCYGKEKKLLQRSNMCQDE